MHIEDSVDFSSVILQYDVFPVQRGHRNEAQHFCATLPLKEFNITLILQSTSSSLLLKIKINSATLKKVFLSNDFVSFFTWYTECTLHRYRRVRMSLLSWLEVLISSKSGVRVFCLRMVQVSLRQKCLRISLAIWTVLYHLVNVNVKGVIHQFCQFLFINSNRSSIFSTFI